MGKRRRLFARSCLDHRRALPIFRNPHQNIAQKRRLSGRERKSEPAIGGLHGSQLACTSGGHAEDRAPPRQRRFQCAHLTTLGRDPAQFEQRSQIIRLGRQNLLHQLLKFDLTVGIALPFNLFRK